jgi:uncharacterized lipoprotein YbaY
MGIRAGLLLLALGLFTTGGAWACDEGDSVDTRTATVTGTITYLARIGLTPDAEAYVALVDITQADAPVVIGEQTIPSPGQVPIAFEVAYDPAAVDPDRVYAVRAQIRDRGILLFETTRDYLVITQGNPTEVEVIVDLAR